MPTFSKTYSGDGGRSNARRAARAAGVDPELVEEHGDGFRFPLQDDEPAKTPHERAKLPAPKASPDFRFASHEGASSAAVATAKRLGLARDAYVVIEETGPGGIPKYAFVPKSMASGFTISTGEAPRPATAPTPSPKKQRTKRDRRAPDGSSKVDQVLTMIRKPGGALMKDICEVTGWLPHTARARISGLAKQHKLTIERQRLMGETAYIAKSAGS